MHGRSASFYLVRAAPTKVRVLSASELDFGEYVWAFGHDPGRRRDLRARWSPPPVDWQSKRRPPGDFVAIASELPIISSRLARQFGRELTNSGHLLPVSVGGRAYHFLLCTVVAPPKFIDQSKRRSGDLLMCEKYALVPERAPDAPVFRLSQDPFEILWRGDFVYRLREWGAKGMSAERVWPWHEDEEVERLRATGRRRKPEQVETAVVRPLSKKEADALAAMSAEALEMLGLNSKSKPRDVVEAIAKRIDAAPKRKPARDDDLRLASLYGNQLVRALGWSWQHGTWGRRKQFVVTPRDRSVYVAPFEYIQQRLRGAENTALLLFNLIVAGDLPEGAKRGGLLELR